MIIIKDQYGVICTDVKKVGPSGCKIIANYKDLEVSDGMGGTTTTINYDLLAEYKSEERAKEVMGMIEEHIEWLVLLQNSPETADSYGGENKFIFTMPAE